MRAIDLDAAARASMAPVCRSCLWWQTLDGAPATAAEGEPQRRDWELAVERETGIFGRLLLEDDTVVGWIQAAPAATVVRLPDLPTSTPPADATLLLCAYFWHEDDLRGFQFLLHDLIAAMKHRQVSIIDAFALRNARPDDRFRGYLRDLNLFNPAVLEGSGFVRVARSGNVARYRLELNTLADAPRHATARERATRPATLPV